MEQQNSKEYINTSTGNDGSKLIELLNNHLSENSSVLQLGIGSGRDLELLSKKYITAGADFSKLLLTMFKKSRPGTDLINIDSVELKTDRRFDCIYSNKVLHQMDKENLITSLQNQHKLLNDDGVLLHSFWSGSKEENHHGLKWVYYTEDSLKKLIPDCYEIVEMKSYKENIDYDSLYMILRKK